MGAVQLHWARHTSRRGAMPGMGLIHASTARSSQIQLALAPQIQVKKGSELAACLPRGHGLAGWWGLPIPHPGSSISAPLSASPTAHCHGRHTDSACQCWYAQAGLSCSWKCDKATTLLVWRHAHMHWSSFGTVAEQHKRSTSQAGCAGMAHSAPSPTDCCASRRMAPFCQE